MSRLHADGMEIEIDKLDWKLFEDDTGLILSPLFEARRGDSVVRYNPKFGAQVGLPGNVLSTEYIRAVLVGYQQSTRRWLLGLHLAKTPSEEPTFRCLIRWKPADSNVHIKEVRQAAHALAVFLTCPLKVFGEKKLPTQIYDESRSGVTGPLIPHNRKRIDKEYVQKQAREINLPLRCDTFSLSAGRSGPVLKLDKQVRNEKGESPVFNMVEINTDQKKVRLIPPTGLLGAFLRSGTQEVPFKNVANVEFRQVKAEVGTNVPSADGKLSERKISNLLLWEVYLTLPDESLLLLQTTYQQSSELLQSRVSTVAGSKFDVNSKDGLNYYRQHMEEQEQIENLSRTTEHAAVKIASAIGVHLVKTEMDA